MKTVVELIYAGGKRRFFSSMDAARAFAETLARVLGTGQHEFTFIEHEVDAP